MNPTNPIPDLPEIPPIPADAGQSAALQPVFDQSTVQKTLTSSFAQMAGGLFLTALTSFVFWSNGLYQIVYTMPMLAMILLFAQLALAVAFGVRMAKASANSLRIMFALYSILTGITFSTLAEVYTGSTLFVAFGISALYFASLAAAGLITKRNLNGLGMICLTGLIVLLISQLVMMLFGTPMSVRLYSILGLLLFTGITAWDVSRMKTILAAPNTDAISRDKWSVYFALDLYLDFINIFLYILRLVSAGSGSSSRN